MTVNDITCIISRSVIYYYDFNILYRLIINTFKCPFYTMRSILFFVSIITLTSTMSSFLINSRLRNLKRVTFSFPLHIQFIEFYLFLYQVVFLIYIKFALDRSEEHTSELQSRLD